MEDITGLGKVAEQLPELTKEFRELIVKALEPSATEIGAIFGNYFKGIKERNLIRGLEKTQKIIEQSNIDPQIPSRTRTFFPVLEQMSLEDDDNLQTKWAKLLASELSGNSVHNIYIETLQKLMPLDANILDFIYDNCSHLFIVFKDDNEFIEVEEDIEFYSVGEKISHPNHDNREIFLNHGNYWINPHGFRSTPDLLAHKIIKLNNDMLHIISTYQKGKILESIEMLKRIDLCLPNDSCIYTYKDIDDLYSAGTIEGRDIKLTEFGKNFMQTIK